MTYLYLIIILFILINTVMSSLRILYLNLSLVSRTYAIGIFDMDFEYEPQVDNSF